MSKKTRDEAFMQVIESARKTESALPATPDIVASRSASAAQIQERERHTYLHVDPARCRIWSGNARRYDLLTEQECADLIESFQLPKGQTTPCTARLVGNDPNFDYEIVVGTRRHWTATYLKRDVLIEVLELSDDQAFLLADIENRARKNLSDYEYAINYRDALDRYFGGHQARMAAQMRLSEDTLSRFLDLAAMPQEIVAAYPKLKEIAVAHMRVLKPLLKDPRKRERLLVAAVEIRGLAKNGAEVVGMLTAALKPTKPRAKRFEHKLAKSKGTVIAKRTPKDVTVTLKFKKDSTDEEVFRGLREALKWAKT